jgi:3-deoxy-D-arabino-heptulosonate 7-phosphate (DAHP) synthase class II
MSDTSPLPWSPSSWASCPSQQLPSYSNTGRQLPHLRLRHLLILRMSHAFDSDAVSSALAKISLLPPLVSCSESSHLSSLIAALSTSANGFILQGGDCAEMFCDCQPHAIDAKVELLRKMADIIRPAAGHVIAIGRIGGQVMVASQPLTRSHWHCYNAPWVSYLFV